VIGETVGGHRLVQKLGEGSMGEVFLGEHGQSVQKAAVKILFPTFSKEGTSLSRYFAEVRSTNLFGHPGIAQIYDCGIHTSGRAYLCMEYLPGKSLAAALGDGDNLGEIATLANIGGQVASALQVVHGKGMVHRALKADSIFLTSPAPYPVIKLLDFGVANFTQNVRHSQTGSLLGAPLYMSPEVGRGLGNVDHRADIYSLGCILFEMATGRPPFVREGAGQLIIAHATEAAPAARTLEPAIPAELDDLIGRCLRKDPGQRPQTMAEIAALIARFSKSAAPAPMFPQMSSPELPPQVATIPHTNAPAFPAQNPAPPRASAASFAAQAAATPWASAASISVQARSVQPPSAQMPAVQAASVAPATAARARPRKPEPTALLQPPVSESPTPVSALPGKQPPLKHPVPRPQATTLLDPPSGPVVVRETRVKRTSKAAPKSVDKTTPSPRLLSPPLIAIGGCIVLCVVAIVVLLVMKKPLASKPGQPSPTPSRAPAAAREEFKPPSPEPFPSAEATTLPDNKAARPASVRAQPPRPSAKTHAERPQVPPSSNKADEKASGSKTAPRW
jgi:serine/threonine protein kinase